MKKVSRSIALVALLLSGMIGMAKEPSLKTDGTKSMVLALDVSAETKVRIVDIDGNIIYTDTILNDSSYTKKFDLSSLGNGLYYIKIENSLKELVYSIVVNKDAVNVTGRRENSKPVFKKTKDRVFLNLLNLDLEPVKITVRDSSDRIVYSETIKDVALVEKAFNFENAFDDTYTVIVKDGMDTYYENILVK